MTQEVHVIGGGLAGCEAAWQIARAGVRAVLYEMRPAVQTPAHKTADLAELVCSNSLKSEQENTAPWLLKEELRRLGSLLIAHRAVRFACRRGMRSRWIANNSPRRSRARSEAEPLIELRREEVTSLDPRKDVDHRAAVR